MKISKFSENNIVIMIGGPYTDTVIALEVYNACQYFKHYKIQPADFLAKVVSVNDQDVGRENCMALIWMKMMTIIKILITIIIYLLPLKQISVITVKYIFHTNLVINHL